MAHDQGGINQFGNAQCVGRITIHCDEPPWAEAVYTFPFVRLSARGAVDLKGDEWQQLSFEGEAMRLTPNTDQIYVDVVTFVGSTYDESAFIAEGLDENEFIDFEDQLDTIVNVNLPAIDLAVPIIYP